MNYLEKIDNLQNHYRKLIFDIKMSVNSSYGFSMRSTNFDILTEKIFYYKKQIKDLELQKKNVF